MKKINMKWIIIGAAVIVVIAIIIFLSLQNRKDTGSEKDEPDGQQEQTVTGVMKDGELVDYEAEGMLVLDTYKNRKVTVTPTETEVYQSILLEAEDAEVEADNADRVQKNDWISLDYVGYIDEQESDALNETGAVIQVGAGNLFNAAFERSLMGLKIGEDYSFDISFPEDYYDVDVAGQDVTFSVTVNAKFNDDYAKAMSKNKYSTVKEYFEYMKVKEEKENRETVGDTVWDELVEKCEVKEYPEGSKKQAYKDLKRSYKGFAEASGFTYDEFIGNLGYTEQDMRSMANDNVRNRMIAKTIAVKENLQLTDEQYEAYLLEYVDPEEEEDKTIKALEKAYWEQESSYPRDDMLIELVKEYIGKKAKMK